jgi:hypothetical protein
MGMSRVGRRVVAGFVVMGALLGASDASAASLSIELDRKEVTYPRTAVKVTVRLDTETGSSSRGYEVRLYEDRFPFGGKARLVDEGQFPAGGRLTFRADAQFNSRYQAIVEDGSFSVASAEKPVYVFPKLNQSGNVTEGGRFRTSLRVRYSPELPVKLAGSKVSFYFRKVGGGPYVRKDTGKARLKAPGTIVGKGDFALPTGRYRFLSLACIDFPRKPLGMFGPDYRYFKCPRKLSPRSGRVAPRLQPTTFSSLSASPFIP